MACSVTRTAVSPATSLDIDPSAPVNGLPCRPIQAARQVSRRAASTEARMSASMNATAWFCPIGRPNWTRVREYSAAYSTAARATPPAIPATPGRDPPKPLPRAPPAPAPPPPAPPQPLLEPVPAADNAPARDPDIGQHDLGGVRGPDAVLTELLPHGQPGRAGRHDEARLAARSERRVHRCDDHVHVGDAAVGGPGLHPVQHPFVRRRVVDRAGPDRSDVTARLWLRGAERAQLDGPRPAEHLRAPFSDLLGRTIGHHRDGGQRAAHQGEPDSRVPPEQFLERDRDA